MRYKVLGFAVWHVGRIFLRRRYGHLVPSRRLVTGAFVVTAVSGIAIAAARRGSAEQ